MRTRHLLLASAAALVLAPAAFAQEGEAPPIFVVSSAFMDTLEEWTSPTLTVESLALESRPELIEEYAAVAEEHYGRPLAELFAELLPQTWVEIAATFGISGEEGGEAPAAAELLAFALAGGSEEFVAWQATLADQGKDFRSFVAAAHPEVAAEVATLGASPAEKGIGLRDFAEAKGTGALDLMEHVQNEYIALKKCYCWTAVAFDDNPGPDWQTSWEEWYEDSWGRLPKKRKKFRYQLKARGAARDIEFYRRSEHHRSEERRESGGFASSRMRVQLLCTRTLSPGLQACPLANACTGWLYTHFGYASRVHEDHSVGGAWERDAATLAADYAALTYEAPGFPSVTLFSKGAAVAGSYSGDWSTPYTLATGFYGGFPLYSAAVGNPNLVTLKASLNDPDVSGFAGLSYRAGGADTSTLDMQAGWHNRNRPIHLVPNQTHYFRIYTSHRLFGRGYGGQSDTSNHIDSAVYMLGMTRRFGCDPTVIPPVDRVFWNYGRAPEAPYDLPTLRARVRDHARGAGSDVTNVDRTPGQYP